MRYHALKFSSRIKYSTSSSDRFVICAISPIGYNRPLRKLYLQNKYRHHEPRKWRGDLMGLPQNFAPRNDDFSLYVESFRRSLISKKACFFVRSIRESSSAPKLPSNDMSMILPSLLYKGKIH